MTLGDASEDSDFEDVWRQDDDFDLEEFESSKANGRDNVNEWDSDGESSSDSSNKPSLSDLLPLGREELDALSAVSSVEKKKKRAVAFLGVGRDRLDRHVPTLVRTKVTWTVDRISVTWTSQIFFKGRDEGQRSTTKGT